MSNVEVLDRTLEERLENLEREITKLNDIEAIKKLKGKYLRCLDSKLWDEIGETFCEDIVTSYSGGKYSFEGKETVVNFFKQVMPPSKLTMHLCHTPEIEILSETTARGVWYLADTLVQLENHLNIRGGAFYDETYEKVDGEWKIKTVGYERTFEERWNRDDVNHPTITENRFEVQE